jgi:predicted O-methyltransferase YrrM
MKKIAKNWMTKMRLLPARLGFLRKGCGRSWRIFTHMTPEERLLLYHLGRKEAQGTIFLEIGSYLGASSCFLAAAARERGGVLHCVDTWSNEAMSEGRRDTWEEFRTNTMPFAGVIRAHRGFSTDMAVDFEDPIALLFMDGDHSYDACKADLEAWFPHLAQGALLVMHDFGWAEGVKRVVEEIIMPRQKERGHILQNTYWTRV